MATHPVCTYRPASLRTGIQAEIPRSSAVFVTDRTTVGTPPKQIARPAVVHYNNRVSPSVCLSVRPSVHYQLVKKTHNVCTTRYILITFYMSALSNHRVTAILMDEALLSIRLTGRGLLVKMLITLEPFGIKNLENCRKTQSIC